MPIGGPKRDPEDCRYRATAAPRPGILDAFGHGGQTQDLDQIEQTAERNPGLQPARQVSIWRCRGEVWPAPRAATTTIKPEYAIRGTVERRC